MTLDAFPPSAVDGALPPDPPATGAEDAPPPGLAPAMAEDQPDGPPNAAAPDEPAALSPAEAALDNARRGTWRMSEGLDGWVLIGANGRPVLRNDGSRVAFRFADAEALTTVPDEDAEPDPRRALAPLDAGLDDGWDPRAFESAMADRSRWARLLAYDYVCTTEPEAAVRRAAASVFGDPIAVDEPGMQGWVPARHDAAAVKSAAMTLLGQALGPEAGEDSDDGALGRISTARDATAIRAIRGAALRNPSLKNTGATLDGETPIDDQGLMRAGVKSQSNRKGIAKVDPQAFVPPEKSAQPLSIPATDKIVPLFDSDGKPIMSVHRRGRPVQVLAPEGGNITLTQHISRDRCKRDRPALNSPLR